MGRGRLHCSQLSAGLPAVGRYCHLPQTSSQTLKNTDFKFLAFFSSPQTRELTDFLKQKVVGPQLEGAARAGTDRLLQALVGSAAARLLAFGRCCILRAAAFRKSKW